MALKKRKTVNGYDAEYWRITQLNMNFNRLDAVIDIALHKDEKTRNLDENSVIETFRVDLGDYFHSETYFDGDDVMKNVSLKEAYKALDRMSKDEEVKRSIEGVLEINEDLAFLADAIEA